MNPQAVLLGVLVAVLLYVLARLFFGVGEVVYVDETTDDADAPPAPPARALKRLNLLINPGILLLLIVAVGLVATLGFLEIFPDNLLLCLTIAIALILLMITILQDVAEYLTRKFEAQLIDAVELMHAASKAGQVPLQCLQVATDASKGAVKEELQEIVKRLDLGLSIEEATWQLRDRYDSDGVRLFCQMLIARWKAGGDFSALLHSVSRILRDRYRLRMRVQGQLAGARYAALFVAALPYLIIPVFLWKDPNWAETFRTHPWGTSAIVGAALLQILGLVWLRRVLRNDL